MERAADWIREQDRGQGGIGYSVALSQAGSGVSGPDEHSGTALECGRMEEKYPDVESALEPLVPNDRETMGIIGCRMVRKGKTQRRSGVGGNTVLG